MLKPKSLYSLEMVRSKLPVQNTINHTCYGISGGTKVYFFWAEVLKILSMHSVKVKTIFLTWTPGNVLFLKCRVPRKKRIVGVAVLCFWRGCMLSYYYYNISYKDAVSDFRSRKSKHTIRRSHPIVLLLFFRLRETRQPLCIHAKSHTKSHKGA